MRILVSVLAALVLAGCTTTVAPDATESSRPDPAVMPIVSTAWDLGVVDVSDALTSSLRGVIAWPDAAGPHPVALVVHGNHTICRDDPKEYGSWPCPEGTEVRNEEGLTYLVEALAQRGFIAVAPGVNVQYTWGAGEPTDGVRTTVLLERTWDALQRGQLGIPGDEVGEVVIGVGHSRGGQDLQLMASGQIPNTLEFDGLLMLMPAVNVLEALPLVDLPTVVVVGSCDGDVGVAGGEYISSGLTTSRITPAVLLLIQGATHNATNSLLDPDRSSARGPGCEAPMAAGAQRSLLAEVAPLAALTMLGQPTSHWTGSIFNSGADHPDGIELALVSPRETQVSLERADTQGFDGVTQCPSGYYTEGGMPGTGPCHRPELVDLVGLPASLALTWSTGGASLQLPLAVAENGTVRIRALVDVADERITAPTVTLRVSAGETTEDFELIVPPVVREDIPPFRVSHGAILWQTFDLVVGKQASELALEVISPAAGSIQVVSVSTLP